MKSKKSSSAKWYVVFVGASPGVYYNWEDVKRYTKGFSKAYFKRYSTKEEAQAAFKNSSTNGYDPANTFTWNCSRPKRR
jgi:viroplasmin and RNaseH domain-containing protein